MNDTTNPPSDDTERPDQPARSDEATAAELIVTLGKETAEYKDRLLRTLAEMENLRRRTDREVADARLYGISNFARDIVTVADNMHRALQALDEDPRVKDDASLKPLVEGVDLTERELMNVLEKHGVKRIDPMGQKFDPNRHQAMYEVEDPSVPAGSVIQVAQSGYLIGDRVLRPAMVAVSKGGPKVPPAEPPANDNSGAK